MSLLKTPAWHKAVLTGKRICYGSRGEPIRFGSHSLRYVPGTRPVKLRYLDSPDVIVRNDARQVKFFLDRVKPGDVVLDVGANVGQYAVLFGALVGASGKVISFEPDSNHRAVLSKNVKLNNFQERVVIEAAALSDENGTHDFFSRNDQMSSLVKSGLGTNADSEDIVANEVKTLRLDDYLAANKRSSVDWVKLDTEGAEINILRGARKLLQSAITVVCELHPYAWNEFKTSYDELLSIVSSCDKQIRYLEPSLRIEDGPVHGAVIIS